VNMIEVRALARRFGSLEAVAGVSFEVGEGELFGFLGPNGAGKTTTINMLCTLLRRAGLRARPTGARRRGPLLGQSGGVGQRRAGLPWPPGAAASDLDDRVRFGRRAPVLSTRATPTG